jgi:hypothetical protein
VNRLLILVLLFTGSISAQTTIQVAGGASTLFNAEGGSVTMYTNGMNSTVGAGVVDGHFVAGANTEFLWRGWDVTAGDKSVFLTTEQVGLSTVVRGVSASRKNDTSDLSVFSGAVGQIFTSPYFQGVQAKEFGTGIQYTRKFTNVDLTTVEAWTNGKPTTLQGVIYHWRGLVLRGTAGLLERQTYFVGQGTWKISHASFDVGRQTYLWQNMRSTVTNGNVSTWFGPVDGHGGVFRSSTTQGENVGAGLHLGPLTFRSDEFWSRNQRTLSGSVMERFSRHWSLAQYITHSGKQTSINFGGTFTSNLVTASVGYQEAFIPFGNVPFQKVLNVSLSFQLPHGTSLNLATIAAPNGGVKWTAYGGTYVQAPWLPQTSQGRRVGRTKIAGYEVRGGVFDPYGAPVVGASIVVNGTTVYTDTSGHFIARIKKSTTVTLTVDVESFMSPGEWEVIDAPTIASPDGEIRITVKRK